MSELNSDCVYIPVTYLESKVEEYRRAGTVALENRNIPLSNKCFEKQMIYSELLSKGKRGFWEMGIVTERESAQQVDGFSID